MFNHVGATAVNRLNNGNLAGALPLHDFMDRSYCILSAAFTSMTMRLLVS